MVHSGYEASAVDHTFGSLKGLFATARAVLFGGAYENADALRKLDEPVSRGGPVVLLTVNGGRQRETVGV